MYNRIQNLFIIYKRCNLKNCMYVENNICNTNTDVCRLEHLNEKNLNIFDF